MTDPGGGYGWRSAEHLPRRRGGVMGWAQVARQAGPLGEERPLCLLLLPAPLETFDLRERAEDLLRAPGVAALDPPRMGYGRRLAETLAMLQARRMRLPGFPRLIVLFDPLQYPLARALISIHPGCELWYVPAAEPAEGSRRRRERIEELHIAAGARATLYFDVDALTAEERFPASGWTRMESLGIESGRLGSERPDIIGS
jgi:hypothetical protein